MAKRTTPTSNGTRPAPSDTADPTPDRAPQAAGERDGARPARRSPKAAPPTRAARLVGGLKGAGSAVRDTVSDNPVPAVLIGTGLAWLLVARSADSLASSSSASSSADGGGDDEATVLGRARKTYREVSERYAEGIVKDAFVAGVGKVGETLSGAAQSVRGGAARVGEYTQEGARAVGGKLREGAAAVGATARKGVEYTREGATTAWDQHPLATGLAAFATGVAVGMFLPGTWRENDIMGRQSDSLSQRVRSAAGTYFRQGKEAAQSTADALKHEVEDEGLAPEQVVRKVRRIAGHVQEAAVGAVRSGGGPRAASRSSSSGGGKRNGSRARGGK